MRALLSVLAVLCLPVVARAEGLITKLPADGTGVVFDLEMIPQLPEGTPGPGPVKGTLHILSVGSETLEDKPFRWLEFQIYLTRPNENELKLEQIIKVLLPEAGLDGEEQYYKQAKIVWTKGANRQHQQHADLLSSGDVGPLPAFLLSQVEGSEEVPAKAIKTPLGELNCQGVKGKHAFKQQDGEIQTEFTSWRNDKSPFGVATVEYVFTLKRDETDIRLTMNLTLNSIVSEAKSMLPEYGLKGPEENARPQE